MALSCLSACLSMKKNVLEVENFLDGRIEAPNVRFCHHLCTALHTLVILSAHTESVPHTNAPIQCCLYDPPQTPTKKSAPTLRTRTSGSNIGNAVIPVVISLCSRSESNLRVRMDAIQTLAKMAKSYPHKLAPYWPSALPLLEASMHVEDRNVKVHAAKVLEEFARALECSTDASTAYIVTPPATPITPVTPPPKSAGQSGSQAMESVATGDDMQVRDRGRVPTQTVRAGIIRDTLYMRS
eukprot:GFYU01059917.1.p1 GENE.GFYU01059917.1~~GFYU01059917.1.p1  ORF type:complete len:240 (+),score=32.78 GFYU01059917.1:444-1163(+)